jgi:hypothetical protein
MSKERTNTCRYCCPSCRLHFKSLVAFDDHIIDGEHVDPRERKRLRVQGRGECRLGYEPEFGVWLWERV